VASWKILVVDDDPDIRRMAALALERLGGFRVVLAAGAEEALAHAAREAPDLVLLDVSMPGMDGPATLRALRELPPTARVPVVFFTAVASDGEAERLLALGAVGVVPKPFDVVDLPRRLRALAAEIGLD
jgi:two-component system OmpR family response regulator